MTHVRQSAKRRKTPVVLTIEQIKVFLSHVEEPCRTAVLLDAASGLRVSMEKHAEHLTGC
jgi:integrase